MTHYKTHKVDTGNYNTFYCQSGEENKQAIIFLHGSGPGANSTTNWRGILPALADAYHVIAPDLYGFGNTDHPKSHPNSFWEWTRKREEQVIELMNYFKIEKAHLVGNSMGGIVSLHLVMNYPERFEKVVLMGSGGSQTEITPELVKMVGFYRDPNPMNLKNLFKWFVYDEKSLGVELETIVHERYETVMRPEIRMSFLSNMFPMLPGEGVIPHAALRRMEASFLLLHGVNDRIMPMEGSLKLLEHLPNAQLHLFNKCGHWIQIEKKESFLSLVRDFLKNKI